MVSESTLLLIGITLVGAFIVNRVFIWSINRHLNKMDRFSAETTSLKFMRNTSRALVWTAAAVIIILLIPKLRSVAITIFAGAGLLVAIIGFAAQAALGNIISGIFIVMFKPFRVGDIIKAGNNGKGIVVDITLRHTVLRDFENKRIIIPNSLISSETVINESINDVRACKFIFVGISYDSDMDLAMKIMQEEASNHPNCIDVRTDEEIDAGEPKVGVRIIRLDEYSVVIRVAPWAADTLSGFDLETDLNYSIKKRFDAEGIEIPFPYRTLVMKTDLPHPKHPEAK
jgi:small conductance mechanosensitive channel